MRMWGGFSATVSSHRWLCRGDACVALYCFGPIKIPQKCLKIVRPIPVRILSVEQPALRICHDVLTNGVERSIVPDDVFKIVRLPEPLCRAWPKAVDIARN